jgi:hypothetical protein
VSCYNTNNKNRSTSKLTQAFIAFAFQVRASYNGQEFWAALAYCDGRHHYSVLFSPLQRAVQDRLRGLGDPCRAITYLSYWLVSLRACFQAAGRLQFVLFARKP